MHYALFGVILCMTNHPECLLSLATGLIYLSIDRQKARSPLSDIVKHTALRSGACFLFWECYKICSDQNKICTRIKYNDNYAVFLWLNNCQEVNVQLAQFYASDMAMLHDKYCQMSILNNRNLFVYNGYKEVAMEKMILEHHTGFMALSTIQIQSPERNN